MKSYLITKATLNIFIVSLFSCVFDLAHGFTLDEFDNLEVEGQWVACLPPKRFSCVEININEMDFIKYDKERVYYFHSVGDKEVSCFEN